jgi:hypothetical protein
MVTPMLPMLKPSAAAALLVACALVGACSSATRDQDAQDVSAVSAREDAGRTPDLERLAEASTNFDQADITPFLTRISRHFPRGLDAQAIARLDAAIAAVPYEQTGRWDIEVEYGGRPERLVIVAYQDDALSPDVQFFSTPEIAAKINQDMVDYSDETGR